MKEIALITGFTGQVGSQLADYLLENTDIEVIGMMRWQEPMDNIYHLSNDINNGNRVSVAYADLNDYTSMYKLISDKQPKFIFHLGAQSFPRTSFDIPIETLQTNIIGTANLLECVRNLKAEKGYDPVVHICSSSEVYGRAKAGNALNEDSTFHGASPYSISKIGTDYLGQFYGEAYGIKTFVTRMGTHTGPRRSDVFFESTVAKQIALIEAGLQAPRIKVGNLSSVRTFQDTRDAVRAYYLLSQASAKGKVPCGEAFNIAGEEAYKLPEVIDMLLSFSNRNDIEIETDIDRLRPIDADYQMFDNSKIRNCIDWKPEIKTKDMFLDLLNHWRTEIESGRIPLSIVGFVLKIRSRAPLRLGIAGGGTDVSPYSDEFGGCVLNATINMFAYAFIDDVINTNEVIFEAKDLGIDERVSLDDRLSLDGPLLLHRAVYKRIMEQYNKGIYIPLRLTTQSDAPPGSGLGSSSTMVVAMLEGFRQLLSLPLGEYDIAHLAFEIERQDCKLSGGKQDQYAATFGGFNFIEFYADDRVIVNPLRMRNFIISELESSLILFFTGTSRDSAKIIDEQISSIQQNNDSQLLAMHQVKASSYKIKELLFKADIAGLAKEFQTSWLAKKSTSSSITNSLIDDIERDILKSGALAMKVSGAGGGGFIMILVEPEKKLDVLASLDKYDGRAHKFQFTNEGAYSWTI